MEVGMGGYLLPSLPPSEYSTVLSSSFLGRPRPLPSPRATPLKPGSKHETSLIRFLDEGLLDVSRKYTKKYTPGGYDDIKTIVKDLQKLVDLIWISSTRWYPSLIYMFVGVEFQRVVDISYSDIANTIPASDCQ